MFQKEDIDGIYRLSSMQENLLANYLATESKNFYIEQSILKLEGNLDIELFKQSFEKLLNETTVLRTVFIFEKVKQPLQVVLKKTEADVLFFDLRAIPLKEVFIQNYSSEQKHKAFDLSSETAFRLALIQSENEVFHLVFTYHHILLDGWSVALLFQKLFKTYESLLHQIPIDNTNEPDFGDFITWYEEQDKENSRVFWKNYLANIEEISPFGLIGKDAKSAGYLQEVIDFEMDSSAINNFCQKQQITANIFFQSLWAVLLSIYTQKKDIIFGLVTSGRPEEAPQFYQTPGLFINTLPIQISLEPQKNFIDLLQKVQENLMQILQHQLLPLNEILSYSDFRSRLFDHVFAFENYSFSESSEQESRTLPFRISQSEIYSKTEYAFNLIIFPQKDNFKIRFNFDTAKFETVQIQRLQSHVKSLISSIFDKPEIPIKDLCVLPEVEREKVIYQFNQNEAAYPKEKNIAGLFKEQVGKQRDKIALVFENQRLSYRELDELSDRVAFFVAENLHGKNQFRVAILLPRSEKLIIAIFGLVKSGVCYVPLDVEFPPERIHFILDDSEASLLITDIENQNIVVKDIKTITIQEILSYPQNYLSPLWGEQEGLGLYLLYTSGTTGKPKGCLISQHNLLRLLFNDKFPFDFSDQDVWLMAHSPAFDFSVWEMYGALLSGATLVIATNETVRDSTQLRKLLIQEQVSILNQTPLSFYNLIESDLFYESKDLGLLRYVIFGGDKLLPHKLEKWQNRYALEEVKLVNMYGITETTVHVTYYFINENDLKNQNLSPIGKPLPETFVYILDEFFNPLPIGLFGEMFIGGSGLSSGYINQERLTAEKFIDNPFRKGEKMYRSGDIGRWNEQGNLEYVARKDKQLKIRGHRIETAEIEFVLREHSAVQEVLVLLNQVNEQNVLIAYYLPTAEVSVEDLRIFLQQKLPEYMIPAFFVQIDQIPLTKNGKIDTKTLLSLELPKAKKENLKEASTAKEKVLHQVWQRVLDLENIDVRDNFFHLGGDSIKAISIASQIQRLGYKLEIKHLFEHKCIEATAPFLEVLDESKSLQEDSPADLKEINDLILEKNPNWKAQKAYSLSPMQEGLLFYAISEPESRAYFEQLSYTIKGNIEPKFIKKTFQKLITRHEVLRTVFIYQSLDEPIQVVLENTPVLPFEYIDLESVSEREKADYLEKFRQKDLLKGFRLEEEIAIRLALVKIREDVFELIWSHHHIILDGWSLVALIREFDELYFREVNFYTGELNPAIPFSPFIHWLKKQDILASIEFWKDYLKDYDLKPKILQTDLREDINYKFERQIFKLNESQSESLKVRAKELGVTLNTLMQAIWVLLLQRYNFTEDVVFGIVSSGRPSDLPSIDQAIGLFINTIPLRVQSSAEEKFSDLALKIQQKNIEAEKHQYLSLAAIQNQSILKQDLISNLLIFDNYPLADYFKQKQEGFELITYQAIEQTQYPLNLVIYPQASEIEIHFLYNANVLNKEILIQVQNHLQRLIQQISEKPEILLKNLSICPKEELEKILFDFNQTGKAYPKEENVIDLFKTQVEKYPQKIAAKDSSESLDYVTLDKITDALAKLLIEKHKVQKGDTIGVALNRDLKTVIALLACLKSGGAYCPIDPNYPQKRIQYILEDCKPRVILTQKGFEHLFPEQNILLLDNFNILLAEAYSLLSSKPISQNAIDFKAILLSEPSFLIYTSGSTGKPKGVIQTHLCLSNLILWQIRDSGMDSGMNVLQQSAFAFDASIHEILFALCSGGTIVCMPEETRKNLDLLENFIRNEKINLFWLPISLLNVAFEENPDFLENCPSVKYMVATGEQLIIGRALKNYMENHPAVYLYNFYGPSESHVVTSYTIQSGLKNIQAIPPIGKAINNTTILILDKYGNLLPVGVSGEIYIGGYNLAIAYKNLPDLDAERFQNLSFFPGTEKRFYRSGDLAYWLPEGNIAFLGRVDEQVKIRGFRVEPIEIESVLLLHPTIKQAVVLPQIQGNTKILIAYLVLNREISYSEIREFLKNYLPDFMIPSEFIFLEQIPLNSNGKIDKAKLPNPDFQSPKESYQNPRNPLEQQIFEIWKDILEKQNFGITDDFFALGGHSIKAMILLARLRKIFRVELSIKDIFHYATIALQAELINNKTQILAEKPLVALPEQELYELSNPQQKIWTQEKLTGDKAAYLMIASYFLEGILDWERLEKAFAKVIRRHEILRTVFIENEGKAYQKIINQKEFQIQLIDLKDSTNQQEIIKQDIEKEKEKPFDLSVFPLFRLKVFILRENEFILLFTIHHLLTDAVSNAILWKELVFFYTHTTEELPDLAIQYKDCSAWFSQKIQEPDFIKAQNLWTEKFNNFIPAYLPTDFQSSSIFNSENVSAIWTKEEEKIQLFCERNQVSPAQLFLATLALLLSRYTGSLQVCVGLPLSGRTQPEMEEQLGIFVNMLPFRTDIQPEISVKEYLQKVKESLLEDLRFQQYPFDKLTEKISFPQNNLYEVVFNFLEDELVELESKEFKIRRSPQKITQNKYPLEFQFERNPQGFGLWLLGRSDLFSQDTLNFILRDFNNLIDALISNESQNLEELLLHLDIKVEEIQNKNLNLPAFDFNL